MDRNPYQLSADSVLEPPTTVVGSLKHLGPGLILSASIVGSGELIATTVVGAKAGFITLWVILVSCLVKVAIQLEFGRHTIATGETTMQALNKLPGPRIGKAHCSIWIWLVLMISKNLQVGGIIGGVAIILQMVFPGIPIWAFLAVLAISVSLLVSLGYYSLLEKASIAMIALFTLFTLTSLFMLQYTEFAISTSDVASGLTFQLPSAVLLFAIGAFGITGVGGDEIMVYNYWLIEKGYARHTGPDDGSDAWIRRAKGWIRIMYLDALLSMVIYTVVTVAFYLLGAAILHSQDLVPEKSELVETLSRIYTETLGGGARFAFLIGAFVVLYSTLFAALAAWTRLFGDAFGQIGAYNFHDPSSRRKAIAFFAWLFPLIWSLLYLFMKTPAFMVIVGGVITTFILVLVVIAAIDFRYRRTVEALRPTVLFDAALWISILAILSIAGHLVYELLKKSLT
jgi:Mn2+/Fe2+ NRAMP family transporter